jgi:hypothetical protein
MYETFKNYEWILMKFDTEELTKNFVPEDQHAYFLTFWVYLTKYIQEQKLFCTEIAVRNEALRQIWKNLLSQAMAQNYCIASDDDVTWYNI